MKKLLLLSLLLTLSLAFTVKKGPLTLSSDSKSSESQLQECPGELVQQIIEGIKSCQKESLYNTFVCIDDFIMDNMDSNWDIFIQSQESPDALAFWTFGGCLINLNNYEQYNRRVILWDVGARENAEIRQQIQKINLDSKKSSKIISRSTLKEMASKLSCSQFRTTAVQQAISLCDVEGNLNAANCILKKLNSSLNEYWDVMVHTTGDSLFSVWYYDDCAFILEHIGQYNRELIIWKASFSG